MNQDCPRCETLTKSCQRMKQFIIDGESNFKMYALKCREIETMKRDTRIREWELMGKVSELQKSNVALKDQLKTFMTGDEIDDIVQSCLPEVKEENVASEMGSGTKNWRQEYMKVYKQYQRLAKEHRNEETSAVTKRKAKIEAEVSKLESKVLKLQARMVDQQDRAKADRAKLLTDLRSERTTIRNLKKKLTEVTVPQFQTPDRHFTVAIGKRGRSRTAKSKAAMKKNEAEATSQSKSQRDQSSNSENEDKPRQKLRTLDSDTNEEEDDSKVEVTKKLRTRRTSLSAKEKVDLQPKLRRSTRINRSNTSLSESNETTPRSSRKAKVRARKKIMTQVDAEEKSIEDPEVEEGESSKDMECPRYRTLLQLTLDALGAAGSLLTPLPSDGEDCETVRVRRPRRVPKAEVQENEDNFDFSRTRTAPSVFIPKRRKRKEATPPPMVRNLRRTRSRVSRTSLSAEKPQIASNELAAAASDLAVVELPVDSDNNNTTSAVVDNPDAPKPSLDMEAAEVDTKRRSKRRNQELSVEEDKRETKPATRNESEEGGADCAIDALDEVFGAGFSATMRRSGVFVMKDEIEDDDDEEEEDPLFFSPTSLRRAMLNSSSGGSNSNIPFAIKSEPDIWCASSTCDKITSTPATEDTKDFQLLMSGKISNITASPPSVVEASLPTSSGVSPPSESNVKNSMNSATDNGKPQLLLTTVVESSPTTKILMPQSRQTDGSSLPKTTSYQNPSQTGKIDAPSSPEMGPNVSQSSAIGPYVSPSPETCPNVSQSLAKGPNVSPSPETGPNVSQSSAKGPNVSPSPETCPDVSPSPKKGPNVSSSTDKGTSVSSSPEKGTNMSASTEKGTNVPPTPETCANVSPSTTRKAERNTEINSVQEEDDSNAEAAVVHFDSNHIPSVKKSNLISALRDESLKLLSDIDDNPILRKRAAAFESCNDKHEKSASSGLHTKNAASAVRLPSQLHVSSNSTTFDRTSHPSPVPNGSIMRKRAVSFAGAEFVDKKRRRTLQRQKSISGQLLAKLRGEAYEEEFYCFMGDVKFPMLSPLRDESDEEMEEEDVGDPKLVASLPSSIIRRLSNEMKSVTDEKRLPSLRNTTSEGKVSPDSLKAKLQRQMKRKKVSMKALAGRSTNDASSSSTSTSTVIPDESPTVEMSQDICVVSNISSASSTTSTTSNSSSCSIPFIPSSSVDSAFASNTSPTTAISHVKSSKINAKLTTTSAVAETSVNFCAENHTASENSRVQPESNPPVSSSSSLKMTSDTSYGVAQCSNVSSSLNDVSSVTSSKFSVTAKRSGRSSINDVRNVISSLLSQPEEHTTAVSLEQFISASNSNVDVLLSQLCRTLKREPSFTTQSVSVLMKCLSSLGKCARALEFARRFLGVTLTSSDKSIEQCVVFLRLLLALVRASTGIGVKGRTEAVVIIADVAAYTSPCDTSQCFCAALTVFPELARNPFEQVKHQPGSSLYLAVHLTSWHLLFRRHKTPHPGTLHNVLSKQCGWPEDYETIAAQLGSLWSSHKTRHLFHLVISRNGEEDKREEAILAFRLLTTILGWTWSFGCVFQPLLSPMFLAIGHLSTPARCGLIRLLGVIGSGCEQSHSREIVDLMTRVSKWFSSSEKELKEKDVMPKDLQTAIDCLLVLAPFQPNLVGVAIVQWLHQHAWAHKASNSLSRAVRIQDFGSVYENEILYAKKAFLG